MNSEDRERASQHESGSDVEKASKSSIVDSADLNFGLELLVSANRGRLDYKQHSSPKSGDGNAAPSVKVLTPRSWKTLVRFRDSGFHQYLSRDFQRFINRKNQRCSPISPRLRVAPVIYGSLVRPDGLDCFPRARETYTAVGEVVSRTTTAPSESQVRFLDGGFSFTLHQ